MTSTASVLLVFVDGWVVHSSPSDAAVEVMVWDTASLDYSKVPGSLAARIADYYEAGDSDNQGLVKEIRDMVSRGEVGPERPVIVVSLEGSDDDDDGDVDDDPPYIVGFGSDDVDLAVIRMQELVDPTRKAHREAVDAVRGLLPDLKAAVKAHLVDAAAAFAGPLDLPSA